MQGDYADVQFNQQRDGIGRISTKCVRLTEEKLMDFLKQTWQQSWFFLIPVILLVSFVVYILLPGVRISHQDSEKLSQLREEKEILNNTLKDLTIQSEAAVCMAKN